MISFIQWWYHSTYSCYFVFIQVYRCQFEVWHICIIQITDICLSIYLYSVRDVESSVISLHLRCNIEQTLHFTPIICWTLDTGVRGERGEGGKRNQFRAGDLLSADLSNTQTLDPPHPEKTLVSLPPPPPPTIGPASIDSRLWLVTQALTSLGWRHCGPH